MRPKPRASASTLSLLWLRACFSPPASCLILSKAGSSAALSSGKEANAASSHSSRSCAVPSASSLCWCLELISSDMSRGKPEARAVCGSALLQARALGLHHGSCWHSPLLWQPVCWRKKGTGHAFVQSSDFVILMELEIAHAKASGGKKACKEDLLKCICLSAVKLLHMRFENE